MKHSGTAQRAWTEDNTVSAGHRMRCGMRSFIVAVGILAASIASAGSEQRSDMAGTADISPDRGSAAAPQSRGGLEFFTDQAAFDAALGIPSELTTENFDGGAAVGPFPTSCDEPMDSTSDDVCFDPGQLAPGFSITSTSANGLIIFPPAFLGAGQVTRAVGATTFADKTLVSFDPAISAASSVVYGGTTIHPVDVEVFDESGVSLGTTIVEPGPTRDTPVFFGVVGATPIGRITFNAHDNGGELFDSLRFRPAGFLPPGIAMSFSPAGVAADVPSTLTITLGNQGQPGLATLDADLVDSLPSGLVVAAVPNASTTCVGGVVTAAAGSDTVTLGSGAQIPAAALCTITVDVSAAMAGLYTNTIPAGALQTDLGDNSDAASAILSVSSGEENTFPPAENFDEVLAPLLPDGWVTSMTSGTDDWTTSTLDSDSAPNSAYAPSLPMVSDFTLDSPVFTPVAGQNVTFRHRYNLERRFDGAVLEISINGGAFADIIDAGGSFVTGGYSYTINDSTDNPIGGRRAWTGNSNGFLTVTVTLPAAAIGQPTRLGFRTANDVSATAGGIPGWWIDSIVLGVSAQPPIATVAPASLAFSVAVGATATDTLDIANAPGSDPLTFSVETRSATGHPSALVPYANLGKQTYALGGKPRSVREPATLAQRRFGASLQATSRPWAPEGSLLFQWDDGSAETALGVGTPADGQTPATERGAVWINRFNASDALVIHTISVFWPVGDGDLTGLQANLVAYYDADADGDATNAVRVGTDELVPISVTGTFQTYQTNFSIPAAGDVYIGFVDQWALAGGFTPRLFPAALDESPSQGMSYTSSTNNPPVDIVNLGNNDINGTVADTTGGSLDGNWMIRATATGGGGGGPCSGPIVNWLTATPSTGSVDGGSDTGVTVTADPAADSLGPGDYTAELCIVTNDPARAVISVPVSMTVTEAPPTTLCNGGPDEIFCDGFDQAQDGGSIVSGTIDQPVTESGDGSSFDFATASYHGYDASITTDDINLYELIGGQDGDGMYVYWYGDAVPADFSGLVGGVVDAGGVHFAALQPGDTVGPGSTISGGSTLMTNWIGGTDAYVGIAFYNEATGSVNYGYLHMTTTGPLGFPAQALEWAYDNSGAAITIP